jgi:hypothetical protein
MEWFLWLVGVWFSVGFIDLPVTWPRSWKFMAWIAVLLAWPLLLGLELRRTMKR